MGRLFEGLTFDLDSGKSKIVTRWNLNSSSLCILLCVFSVMLLIVVLPEVDLPDTAFQRGTAPIVVHTQATSGPPVLAVARPVAPLFTAESLPFLRDERAVGHFAPPNFLPIFHRSIRR
jgi:hypothetical protein